MPRFYALMTAACAVMAVTFVTLGLFGVISYAVSRRTAEIGIRMALGATRQSILGGVLWQGCQLASIGAVFGLILAFGTTRFLATLLFEITPLDPWTLVIAVGIVIAVTLTASYLPARRASRLQPVVALRHD